MNYTNTIYTFEETRTFMGFSMPCEANVTKQPVMLMLLACLAVSCTLFWTECTWWHGAHFQWIEAKVSLLSGRLIAFVADDEKIPEYWCAVFQWVLGQLSAYTTNLSFEHTLKPFVQFATGIRFDPLDLYLALLVHDDVVGSFFRFGTWTFFSAHWRRLFHFENRSLLVSNGGSFSVKYGEVYVDLLYAFFSIACWVVQVLISNFFAFTVASVLFVLLRERAPVVILATFFAHTRFSTCRQKILILAVSIRFGLETLHAAIGPYLIRIWGKSAPHAIKMSDSSAHAAASHIQYFFRKHLALKAMV